MERAYGKVIGQLGMQLTKEDVQLLSFHILPKEFLSERKVTEGKQSRLS